MVSFGMEYERAFSIAFWSARLPPGSPPPSRAATIRARDSLEKSLPRFASAAPFLCLIEDHLLCPDMRLLPHEVQKPLVHSRVIRQLRVERREQEAPVANEHRLAVVLREYLDAGADLAHARRADEDAVQRLRLPRKLDAGLEARHLPPVCVAVDEQVDEPQMVAVEH